MYFQSSNETKETFDSKNHFASISKSHGVNVKARRADNHTRDSKLFRQSCTAAGQGLSFSGVDAHHQYGVAERKIEHATNLSRTMMFHIMLSWSTHVITNP